MISNGTDEDLDQYYAFGKQTVIISDDFDRVSQGTVYQLLMSCRESDFSTILDGVHGAKITSWWDRAVDIIPATGGKGTGIASIMVSTGLRRWHSGMEIMTLRCSRQWARALPWKMHQKN